MTLDIETRFRDDLAAITVEIPVDPDAVLAAGRRARARRSGTGIAVVAAIAAVAVGVIPSALGMIHAVPEPARATRAVAEFPDAMSIGAGQTGIMSAQVAVTRLPAGGELEVTADVTPTQGDAIRTTFTRPDAEPWGATKVGAGIFVAVLPSAALWIQPVSDKNGWTWDHHPLDGMDLTAVVLVADSTQAEAPGLLWKSTDGVVRDSLGNDVASGEIVVNGSPIQLYADPALDTIGAEFDGGGGAGTISGIPADHLAFTTSHRSGRDPWITRGVFLLPEGARDPELVTPDGDTLTASTVLRGGDYDGRAVAVYQATLPSGIEPPSPVSPVTSIRYTDADGKQVTVAVARR